MTETLIKFKTAKLAKERGFNETGLYAYSVWRGSLRKADTEESALEGINLYIDPFTQYGSPEISLYEQSNQYTLAPTQALLQKWLREEHNLEISITPVWANPSKTITEYTSIVWLTKEEEESNVEETHDEDTFATYEEALESGLQEALNLIK